MKISNLIHGIDALRFIKSRRTGMVVHAIAWLGHAMSIEQHRIPRKILEWRPLGKRLSGRPRKRRIEDIEENLRNKKMEKTM